jgi:hypothetical protein
VVTPVAGFSSAVVVRGATGGDTRWNRLRKVVQAQPDEELQSVPRREYSVANRIKDGATHSYTLRSTAMDSGRRSDSDLCLSPAPLLPTMYKDGQAPHPNRRYFITKNHRFPPSQDWRLKREELLEAHRRARARADTIHGAWGGISLRIPAGDIGASTMRKEVWGTLFEMTLSQSVTLKLLRCLPRRIGRTGKVFICIRSSPTIEICTLFPSLAIALTPCFGSGSS